MADKKEASDDAWEKLKGLPITGKPSSSQGHSDSGWGWGLFSRPVLASASFLRPSWPSFPPLTCWDSDPHSKHQHPFKRVNS